MASRLELQNKLEELLGMKHVYYQPPESKKLEYPAIVYSKSGIVNKKADDRRYHQMIRYALIVIDRIPDNQVIEKLLDLPYCSYDRSYVADNLNHDSLTIYF